MTSTLPIRPMNTNPGGVINPNDLIGRAVELGQLLSAVDTGGAKLLGDRRMGKTSLLRLLEEELQAAGHTVVRVSAETEDPAVFSRNLVEVMRKNQLLGREWGRWQQEFGGEVTVNAGVAGVRLRAHAATASDAGVDFFRRCAEAVERSGPHRLVFIFDEITVLARALGPDGAVEFMRTLRQSRQEIERVSMILSGSIGLHHAVTDMSVVNDIVPITVSPLADWEATYLARCLLRGESLAAANEVEIAETIADQTCSIPFYVHKLVEDLANRGSQSVATADVIDVVDHALRNKLWEMEHYIDRVPKYYGDEAALVLRVLDVYARSVDPLEIDAIANQLGTVGDELRPSRDTLIRLVGRLEDDHYLVRLGAADRFATSLLRRAWREMRRLG
ncbi:MAG: AAA family ATPase [Actinomycetota bacterium]|nr:AAA family ATPase [Actinomycetota bacterium]MDQ2956713.1 AAA family ATPase [Actinomycetota bacterium]